jgi:PAS domain S-box-containing protein
MLTGAFDPRIVAVSIAIAVLTAAAALDLAGRVTPVRSGTRFWWLTGGAVALGFGLWSMHSIGMLAFQLPVVVLYNWPTVLLSLLAAVAAAGVALFVVSRETMKLRHAIVGALFMGSGLAAMHYLDMAALRMPAKAEYSTELVTLSIVLAVIVAFTVLQMAYAFRGGSGWSWYKAGTAVALGAAIPITHYVGMAAVTFVEIHGASLDLHQAISVSDLQTLAIAGVTLIVLGGVFLSSTIDRQLFKQSRALQSSEQRCRLTIETALDAFLQIDTEGVITDWNARAEEIFGWQRFEVVGRRVETLIAVDRESAGNRQLREILRTTEPSGVAYRLDIFVRHRDGHEFPVEMALAAVWLGTKFIYAAFVHDVTARRLAQTERETARIAAEAGNRAKTEFLANITYEIRTPMNGVIGMTELLLDTPLSSIQRDYAENIRESANTLLTIINDILDFSKVEAGKLELEPLDVDLRDTIEDVARLISIQAHARGLEVTTQIDPQLASLVKADPGRVRQIVLNLASNAVKFTRQGEVALEVRVLETGPRGTQIRCEVRDTGIGIAADRLKDLFAPFTQVSPATTRQLGGSGVGLSIVRRLAELMEGQVGVESTPGVGSMFWFTAWFAVAQQPAHILTIAPSVSSGRRVLLVDDNITNRKVLMGQLLQCGVDPVSAGSAGEALMLMRHAAAVGRPFEVVLLDHQMPDCDGAEAGRIILSDAALASARLILLTASGQRGEGQTFADLGFAAYLLKPVSQRDLVDCLSLALGSGPDTWRARALPMITRHALRAQRPG